MRAIPFGRTREYGEIARSLGATPREVGAACGRNTIAIIVPCHRVVGAAGLGGFSAPGGVETKIALLRHERAYSLLL
jgi:methylated-DNA-[protein]-cysteine S-methyltransferase